MGSFIISGATGHLGVATVDYFLERGHQVIALGHKTGASPGFAESHPSITFHSIDLKDEEACERFVTELLDRTAVHGVVALAGGFAPANLQEANIAAIRSMIELNFETAYNLVRPLFPRLMEAGYGRIVLVGAKPVLRPADAKGAISYALSKSLLFHLAEILNASAGGINVTSSVIVPSVIDTNANRQAMPKADFSKWVNPLEIAETIEFICSDAGRSLREPVFKLYGDA